MRWTLAALLVLFAEAVAAQTAVDPEVRIETVVDGLELPTTLAFLGPDDFLVLEKATGRVRRVRDGALLPDPVLDVAVNPDGERGLLGIAINSETPPAVFLYYVAAADPSRSGADGGPTLGPQLYRYRWNPSLGVLEDPQRLLVIPRNPAHACHKGGVLVLGPPAPGPDAVGDGAPLYVVTGDLGLGLFGPGQLTNEPEGELPDDRAVIFRIRQDGSPAAGNPFTPYCSGTPTLTCAADTDCPADERCVTEVARYFAYGVRNSFGLALDPLTGDLWDTENGPFNFDEVNRVEPGMNSGWNAIMGPRSRRFFQPTLFDIPGAGSTYSDPEFSWLRTVAPTAILFPVGSALGTAQDDDALVADNNNGQIYAFPLDEAREGFALSDRPGLEDAVADDESERDSVLFASGFGVVTDLEVGPDGQVYAVDLVRGSVYRLRRELCPPEPDACVEPLPHRGSRLDLRDRPGDRHDRLFWSWRGERDAPSDFGDPLAKHDYALCLYDRDALRATLQVRAGGRCGRHPCWRSRGDSFLYADRAREADGVRHLLLHAGPRGPSILVNAGGPELPLPELATLASPLTVQLHRSGDDVCWGARFRGSARHTHSEHSFRATAQ